MSEPSKRAYRCQVVLTVNEVSQAYRLSRNNDGAWVWEKQGGPEDGQRYVVRNVIDRQTSPPLPPVLVCSCKGYQTHRHCKHAEWLRMMGIGLDPIQQAHVHQIIGTSVQNERLARSTAETLAEITEELTVERERCDELVDLNERKNEQIDQLAAERDCAREGIAQLQDTIKELQQRIEQMEIQRTPAQVEIAEVKSPPRRRKPARQVEKVPF